MSDLGQVWRDEWGRLLALLVAQYRRLDLAEDGLADAFEAAAREWPDSGLPANPAAWLLVAARRRVVDRLRKEATLARKAPLLVVDERTREEAQRSMADAGQPITDERLRLILLCSHPELPAESAAALTLRLVLGLSTQDIAGLFLVSQPTMAARLTRARRRLAGATFEVPDDLAGRADRLATVIYLAFTHGYLPGGRPGRGSQSSAVASGASATDDNAVQVPAGRRAAGHGTGSHALDLADEAIRLGRLAHALLPSSSVLRALLALMLLQHARRDARHDGAGLVLLPDQDRSAWHHDEIDEALALLRPLVAAPPEPYLLQALIAAEHSIAPTPDETDWARIVSRYDELLALGDSPVVRLNRAVAVAEADGPLAGLAALTGVDVPGHRLPGVRAELLARAGRRDEAQAAFDDAIALCDNEPERELLRRRRELALT